MTGYAIRHANGRYLTRAIQDRRIVWIWIADPDVRETWPTMTAAVLAALEADRLNRLDWTVELETLAKAS